MRPDRPAIPSRAPSPDDLAKAEGPVPGAEALRALVKEAVAEAVAEVLAEKEQIDAVQQALGPDVLLEYTHWRKANNISHELGMKLRKEGKLKVVQVGSKLMIRLGHARDFVRKLPLS